MKHIAIRRWLLAAAIALSLTATGQAPQYRNAITPRVRWGLGFNADTNHPAFSGSLRLMAQLGTVHDVININAGVGYRGFFDREPPVEFLVHPSFSDYVLYTGDDGYTKRVRPMGGQVIVPAEFHINMFRLDDDARLFIGCGAEWAARLYQSHRYADHYGAHVMRSSSLGFYPMVGAVFDADGADLSLALYWRHQAHGPFNGADLPIDKFTARDFFGIQLYVVL